MPLDLKKIITQITNLESQDLASERQNRLDSTFKVFQEANNDSKKLLSKLAETQSSQKANFFYAIPEAKEESLDELFKSDKNFSLPHITIATDGSQTNPSAHEFTSAFLINTGLVGIPYFNSSVPVTLESEPVVYDSIEDLNSNAKNSFEHIQDEDMVSYERTLKEIEELVKLAKTYTKHNLPIIALLDGTLIHWHIEKFNSFFIEQFIKRFSNAVFELRSLNIPVASFLSNSRSNEVINMLRIFNFICQLLNYILVFNNFFYFLS